MQLYPSLRRPGSKRSIFAAPPEPGTLTITDPVVISMTSIPSRLGGVERTLASLRRQTRPPDEIRIYLGPECPVVGWPGARVRRVPHDLGPLTKILAATERLPADSVIVTVDDDIEYEAGWLAALLEGAAKHPREAVGFAAWNRAALVEGGTFEWVQAGEQGDVLEGWAGAAYRRWMFGQDLLDLPDEFRFVDDVWLSAYLARANVVRRVIGRPMSSHSNAPGIHDRPGFEDLNRRAARQFFRAGREAPGPYLTRAMGLLGPGRKRVVEIGSMRRRLVHDPRDGSTCQNCLDGHSTFLFCAAGHDVWTVDVDHQATAIAREACIQFPRLRLATGDGIQFLKSFEGGIDLLYLDGWDAVPGAPYAERHLEAFLVAERKMAPGGIVVIDDTDVLEGGKGRMAVPAMMERGYQVLVTGRQTIMRAPRHAPVHKLREPLLTICISSLASRAEDLAALLRALWDQDRSDEIEILVDVDCGGAIVGDKRNRLVAAAAGRYIVHFDDDDQPATRYLPAILEAIDQNPGVDAILIRGRRTKSDQDAHDEFDYSVGGLDGVWRDGVMWRSPGHLCPIRSEIAKAVRFPSCTIGEDIAWVQAVKPLLRTSARAGDPGEVLYLYRLDPKKEQRP